MRKSLSRLTPATLLLLAAAGSAQAASNAQLTVTATVATVTCDVSLTNSNLDLGNFAVSDFIAVSKPLVASQKAFSVGLTNCGIPKENDSVASVVVTGPTLAGHLDMFNSNTSTNGVMLSTAAAATTYIKSGQKLEVAKVPAKGSPDHVPAASDFNGKSLKLLAGLASTNITDVDLGPVSAPILFSFAYN